jgi:hypothetical protein
MGRLSNPLLPAMAQLPSGFFRVPDRRGRFAVGAGLESKTPGIYDPPLLAKGDDYDATSRAVGDIGGEEKHRLTVPELARHRHPLIASSGAPYSGSRIDGGRSSIYPRTPDTDYAGNDTAHNTMPPLIAMNYYIKAQ